MGYTALDNHVSYYTALLQESFLFVEAALLHTQILQLGLACAVEWVRSNTATVL